MKIGVLAVQGDFEAHAASLKRLGVDYIFVRTPRDLAGVDALVLPGGRKLHAVVKFLVREVLDVSIREHAAKTVARSSAPAPEAILLASRSNQSVPGITRSVRHRRDAQRVRTASSPAASTMNPLPFLPSP